MFAVNGCWKRNSFSTPLLVVVAAAVVVVAVAFHFPLVGLAEFFDSLGNASETYHRRFANVLIVNGPQYYYCSSQIQPDDTDTCGLDCLYYFKRRHRGMQFPDIVKDFSTVDLKGNEDNILRTNC
jgi:hypothetical protein